MADAFFSLLQVYFAYTYSQKKNLQSLQFVSTRIRQINRNIVTGFDIYLQKPGENTNFEGENSTMKMKMLLQKTAWYGLKVQGKCHLSSLA